MFVVIIIIIVIVTRIIIFIFIFIFIIVIVTRIIIIIIIIIILLVSGCPLGVPRVPDAQPAGGVCTHTGVCGVHVQRHPHRGGAEGVQGSGQVFMYIKYLYVVM
jgi:hypothetical protein